MLFVLTGNFCSVLSISYVSLKIRVQLRFNTFCIIVGRDNIVSKK